LSLGCAGGGGGPYRVSHILAKGEEGGGFAGIARSIAPYSEGDVDELVSSVYFCFLATISASETRWSTEAKHEWASQQAYIYIYIYFKKNPTSISQMC
jgi:hypothetical protein